MKKFKIYSLVCLILFNFFTLNFFSFKLNKNISKANAVTDDIKKAYFIILSAASGYYSRSKDILIDLYNKSTFKDNVDFVEGAKEFAIRQLFKGKESYKRLISENILRDNNYFSKQFTKNVDLVSAYLNKSYYTYSKSDFDKFSDKTDLFAWQIDKHYVFSCPKEQDDVYNNGLHKFTFESEPLWTTITFSNIIWKGTYNEPDNALCVAKDPRGNGEHDYKVSYLGLGQYQLLKDYYGYSIYNREFDYECYRVYCTKFDYNGNVTKDGYIYIYFGGPLLKSHPNFKKSFDNATPIIEDLFTNAPGNLHGTDIKVNDGVLYKSAPKSINYLINAPNYNYFYKINNNDDLQKQIDAIFIKLNNNSEYLLGLNDYINNLQNDLSEDWDEIVFAINTNNDVIFSDVNNLKEDKVDYSDLDKILEDNNKNFVNNYIDGINSDVDDLSKRVNNLDVKLDSFNNTNVNNYNNLKSDIENLHEEFILFKSNIPNSDVNDYAEDFKLVNKKLDVLKTVYDSKFDVINNKLDNLEISNINYTTDEKQSLKDGLFSGLDFLKSFKDFFTNFFVITENVDFSPFTNIDLSNKFPFCLPSDFLDIFKSLQSQGKAPVFTFKLFDESIVLDFGNFEQLAKVIRYFSLLFFIIFLLLKTYDKFGG